MITIACLVANLKTCQIEQRQINIVGAYRPLNEATPTYYVAEGDLRLELIESPKFTFRVTIMDKPTMRAFQQVRAGEAFESHGLKFNRVVIDLDFQKVFATVEAQILKGWRTVNPREYWALLQLGDTEEKDNFLRSILVGQNINAALWAMATMYEWANAQGISGTPNKLWEAFQERDKP